MPIRRSLDLPEIQLSFLEWKNGKEPLILLHGLADNALVWSSLGDYLSRKYHIVAPDLRGHGESSKPAEGYTFERAIADLEALISDLKWSSVHILGHSWTGKLLTIWASRNPKRFRSLILVDPFFIGKIPSWSKITFPLLYRVLPFLQAMGPFSSYEAAEKKARKLKQYREWTLLQEKAFKAGMEKKADGTYVSKFTTTARDRLFAEVMAVAGLTAPIEIPTLFIQPEKGLNRTQWQLQPYKKYLKNLTITTIPGNHWVHLVQPEVFNQTVEAFLKQIS